MTALQVVYWSLGEGELHRVETDQVPNVGESVSLPGASGTATVIQRDFAAVADGSLELRVQVEFTKRSRGSRWWQRGH
ncbi:hypothetical protein ASD56_12510 [Microbacterium sp. Root166]|uniref:hypothetical protein n=1 Tax=Microbacterium sp. Root166 TaxID=1736478 RepID=UPI0006F7C302|nr:hypothetical protein [Microbacterium sp. Root166]KQZ83144.1 hypothetical protein ASD56_12510 [Microbacterium sp. Root166]